jgi:tetratricopeptide (TPR) repeat protein
MKKNILLILAIIILGGCAAVGVPSTSDPIEKLKWADELYNSRGRPFPAEKLINEAIIICQENNNSECLGKAYLSYGFFLRSPSIEKNHINYKKYGFRNSDITYDNRFIKSKEYFEKAIPEFLKIKSYDALTNAYLNLGFAYYFLGEHKSECEPYRLSLEYNKKNLEINPQVKISLPKGFSTYKEYVAIHQKRAGCL